MSLLSLPPFRFLLLLSSDVCAHLIQTATEESKKVDAAGGKKYLAVYRRIECPR